MAYFDTSVLVTYYCPEALSEKAESLITKSKSPTISHLVEVEMMSALSKKVRSHELAIKDAKRVKDLFLEHLSKNFFLIVPVTFEHFRLAREWIGHFETALKTLDALHLAIAASLDIPLVTFDKTLRKAAKSLGIKINAEKIKNSGTY